MNRTYLYARVSTGEQTTDNQFADILSVPEWSDVPKQRQVSEVISGGMAAMKRPAFKNLVENKLEAGDTLVVSKIDRLGRDSIDVQSTILGLAERGIKVVSLDLPTSDLTSSEGKLMLQMFAAFAEFEKARIIERTQSGLRNAKAKGVKLGRPEATNTTLKVLEQKSKGMTQSQTAKQLSISLATVKRHWNKKQEETEPA
ncbi:recombinase family protein [Litoribrevibacter euphylliae]|uniref:Recombinase family protein n=1 Tax=Litoribrevibacter euphylliae TaxID=1834034 RepID=A0ABV7HE53_9GAMM